ncbi:MAG: carboxymuconolactone decarboxylase family protein [Bacteroidetes bacterium]|nr:carboxymuconolactone decarboxylase family protein [Bacteroidota bacterium]
MEKEITTQQVYDLAMESFGVVPGIVKELAERSKEVAYIFTKGSMLLEKTTFTFTELNVMELKVSLLNKCDSCIKGHTYLLKKEGVSDLDIKAIIVNQHVSNERFENLLTAVENIYYAGSAAFPEHVTEHLQNNFTEKEIVEIIGIIGVKTIANYTNNFLVSVKK